MLAATTFYDDELWNNPGVYASACMRLGTTVGTKVH